jgi:lipoprotein-anchoring transpeptidase ErfK/SrfK
VKAEHLHVFDPDEVSPLSPDVPAEKKRIEVILSDQVFIAYEYDTPVFMSKVATGASFTGYRYSTPTGRHYTFYKRPSRHMASGAPGNPVGFDLPGVPWVCFINKEGISFHGTYWHNDFGKPRSHGCINLPTNAAKWVYRWTTPSVPFEKYLIWEETGTRVDVI